MLKIEKEYNDIYGEIPKDYEGRLDFILDKINIKRLNEPVYEYMKKIRNIPWKNISYTIYLLPKATPRPRSGKNGIFYVKGAKDNKKFFQNYIIDQNIDLITTPCKFSCTSYFPIPSSMSNIEKIAAELGLIRPISKPDWDNVAKAYCDMIQGLLIYDDSLIIEGTSKKFYSVKPRIEITISYMENFDSQFNKKKILNKKGR
jgi:Holliday junction resolvase RusA-like endonuclease